MEVKEEEVKIKNIPVVCEFSYVFAEELLGLAPQQEIDFEIELLPSAQPISKAHTNGPNRTESVKNTT